MFSVAVKTIIFWIWNDICTHHYCVFLIILFTQFSFFSLLSMSLLCSSSPTPPGAPNCFTICWVLLSCSSVSRCFIHLRYISSVSFRVGSGSFGRPWAVCGMKDSANSHSKVFPPNLWLHANIGVSNFRVNHLWCIHHVSLAKNYKKIALNKEQFSL